MTSDKNDLEQALGLSVALLGAMYIVVRPIANQFMPYCGEAAFAGLLIVLLAFCLSLKTLLKSMHPLYVPDRLALAAILWVGVFVWGALRSPNAGVALPQACDAVSYIVLLLCGYFAVRREPALAGIFTRALVAMIAVEAFAGVWQRYVDLPRLWREVAAGRERLPDALGSSMGQARLYGDDIFGTFANPNSLAAYLLVGIFLLLGLAWPHLARPPIANSQPPIANSQQPASRARAVAVRALCVLLLVLMLFALSLTNSKGGMAACLAGAWFFAVQRVNCRSPRHGRLLAWLTAAGILAMLAVLALGLAGVFTPPRSLAVRLEYWKAAFGMLRSHPLDGVGLGGFGETYSFFKTPLGTETLDAHNDYLHFLAELGVLGPLVYLGVWGMLLRAARPPATVTVAANAEPAGQGDGGAERRGRAVALESLALAGGVLGFVFMDVAFGVFNSADVLQLFSGAVNAQNISALLHTLALPVIFVCVVVGLRDPGLLANPGHFTAWTHGLRAAGGAILVHQLVDFDFKAQAVIGGLFLLGGMLLALNEPALQTASPAPTPLGRLPRYLLPAFAVLLFPGAVWIPMSTGLPRVNADTLEDEARRLAREKPPEGRDPEKDKAYRELRREIARYRLAAADAAPFDGSAWLDLAAAYDGMQRAHNSFSMRQEILFCLAEGERRRPLSASPKLMFGDFYFRNAVRAIHHRLSPGRDFTLAGIAYSEAAQAYPLAPGIRMLAGDALLMDGQTDAAAEQYRKAFATDGLIADYNLSFSAIFVDPRPRAAARHGYDADVLTCLDTLRTVSRRAGPFLCVRRVLAIATVLREHERGGSLKPEAAGRLRAELLRSSQDLVAIMPQPAERAHAALLHALSFELTGDSQAPSRAAAWDQARRLQEESVRNGAPGTQPGLFNYLNQRYNKRQP